MQPERRFVWQAESQDSEGPPPQPESRRRPAEHACRVLVVDDDVITRAQLCALLHGSGYEVETAASGADALRLLRSHPCDIVVTDCRMPKMDGLALCREVRALEQQDYVYLLMLTIKKLPGEILAGFAAGADDYVVKGTSAEELLARLDRGRRIAHWRAAHRSSRQDPGNVPLVDSDTGVYNSAYLVHHLPRELSRSERHGHSMGLLSCEIEATEQGTAGDDTVGEFVSCAMTCIRQHDWLVRTGSNEFIVVLPETDRRGAERVARKLTEAHARRGSSAARESTTAAIKIEVTAVEPHRNTDGPALVRALLREASDLRHRDEPVHRRTASPGSVQFLCDFAAGSARESGKNWPAT